MNDVESTVPTWEQIVQDHSARVFRLAYRLTGNRYDAEDLTQDVFVRVLRSLDRYEPGNFDGWLHRITTNLFLDGARRRQRIRMDAMGDDAARVRPPERAAAPFCTEKEPVRRRFRNFIISPSRRKGKCF